MDWSRISRKLILGVAGSRPVTRVATKYGMRLGAARFVAGESLEDAIEAVKRLNDAGIMVTLDHLGESVTEPAAAQEAAEACFRVLERISQTKVNANLSLKLTQLGLDISEPLCQNHMEHMLNRAKHSGNFVRIDMESSKHTQITIDLFKQLRAKFDNVGLVIQGYLYRSAKDLEDMAAMKANIRLVKGAYNEPESVAFPKKSQVDDHFKKLIEQYILSGNYTAVATHDEDAIRFTKDLIAKRHISRDKFEFQMLYGIRSDLQQALVQEGYRVRAYVPYGRDWYPYFTRRLAERPANLAFVARNFFKQ